MKRIITFVVTAFYAVAASAQEKTSFLDDLINKGNEKATDIVIELSGWNSLVEWFDQLIFLPPTWGGLIACAMSAYGIGMFLYQRKLSKNQMVEGESVTPDILPTVAVWALAIAFAGWLVGMTLTWVGIPGLGWATLFIPIIDLVFYLVKKWLRGTWLEKLNRGTPTKPSLAEGVQAGDSSKIKGFEECPSCHKPSLGINVCSAGCGYRRPTADATPVTATETSTRVEGAAKSSTPKNLAEANKLLGDR